MGTQVRSREERAGEIVGKLLHNQLHSGRLPAGFIQILNGQQSPTYEMLFAWVDEHLEEAERCITQNNW